MAENSLSTGLAPLLYLKQEQARLGLIEVHEIRAPTIVDAHRQLGEIVGGQFRNILTNDLNGMSKTEFQTELKDALKRRDQILASIQDETIDPLIRKGIQEFFDSAEAFGKGVGLDSFHHPVLEGMQIKAGDLVWYYEDGDSGEEAGCQTGILRIKNGLIGGHTEEDSPDTEEDENPFHRMDKVRMVKMIVGDGPDAEEMNALVYPDLMPGPGFSWRSGYMQAVDFLYLKSFPEFAGSANMAAWMTLRYGDSMDPEKIIHALGPYIDGYVLNIIRRDETGELVTERILFAGDNVEKTQLRDQPGNYLFQVNVVSDKSSALAQKIEEIDESDRKNFEQRQERIKRLVELANRAGVENVSISDLQRIMAFRVGDKFAMANPDVKAYVLFEIADSGTCEILIGSGPALRGEKELQRFTTTF